MRDPVEIVLDLSFRVINAGLRVVSFVTAPITDPVWNHFAALILPPTENDDVYSSP